MPTHRVKLLRRQEVAERTIAFAFEKPSSFEFKAGQYADVILINPLEKDNEGIARSFSIASAPHESVLLFATRMRDTAFKRVLGGMAVGAEVEVEGPYGSFTLHNNPDREAVLVAGGIGITPFRSILLQAAEKKLPHRLILLYSNRTPEGAAFLDELQQLQSLNDRFKLVATMTEMEKSRRGWDGERGLLNPEMLTKHCRDLKSPIYYLVGPPGMVAGVHQSLNQMGVDDDDIRSEEFSGY